MSEQTRPTGKIRSVTPNDTTNLPGGDARGFHCNVAGDVEFNDLTDNTVILTCLAGVTYPYACRRILDANTTATGIFVLY